MKFDDNYYENVKQEFITKIKNGEFPVEVLENNGPSRDEREKEALATYEEYLESEDFKLLIDGVFTK